MVAFWISSPTFFGDYIERKIHELNRLQEKVNVRQIHEGMTYQTKRTNLWSESGSSSDLTSDSAEYNIFRRFVGRRRAHYWQYV